MAVPYERGIGEGLGRTQAIPIWRLHVTYRYRAAARALCNRQVFSGPSTSHDLVMSADNAMNADSAGNRGGRPLDLSRDRRLAAETSCLRLPNTFDGVFDVVSVVGDPGAAGVTIL